MFLGQFFIGEIFVETSGCLGRAFLGMNFGYFGMSHFRSTGCRVKKKHLGLTFFVFAG